MSAISSSVERNNLYQKFRVKISQNPCLDRSLVSFQGNKQIPFSSWFKYREGFSEQLVTYLLKNLRPEPGILLDPFAGVGSSLFAASALGWKTIGIELLPVGVFVTQARIIATKSDVELLKSVISQLKNIDFLDYYEQNAFNHLAITRAAFSSTNEKSLLRYISYCQNCVDNKDIRTLLRYAAFCILEEISYTRKDGQYLRWDARSGRSKAKKEFNKGRILSFEEAIFRKLTQIASDLSVDSIQLNLFDDKLNLLSSQNNQNIINQQPNLYQGSCLEILPTLKENSIDCAIISPPYVNRYDYTRTYALELAFLGCNEEKIKNLRQTMLSCTLENRHKRNYLENFYFHIKSYQNFLKVNSVFENQAALKEVLTILEEYKKAGNLNNKNIIRMVHNYFYEMCFVIYELSRTLKPGGVVAMVNDNVRYAGEEIPVDLILSNIAESFGLEIRYIWTLGRGKGNSSQQMRDRGRSELRKCVYVWEKKVL